MLADLDARMLALASELGSDRWGWDEWNWIYHEVTGQDGPAPEDRGLSRDASGAVLINGVAKYPYGTWKQLALGAGPAPQPGPLPPDLRIGQPRQPAQPLSPWLLVPVALGALALRGLLR